MMMRGSRGRGSIVGGVFCLLLADGGGSSRSAAAAGREVAILLVPEVKLRSC